MRECVEVKSAKEFDSDAVVPAAGKKTDGCQSQNPSDGLENAQEAWRREMGTVFGQRMPTFMMPLQSYELRCY